MCSCCGKLLSLGHGAVLTAIKKWDHPLKISKAANPFIKELKAHDAKEIIR